MNNDQQLIELALHGNTAAYGQLVRRYQDRLFTSLGHVVSSREEAEDVVQDAFVQAMLKLSSFRQDSSFYTWLYRIAINSALYRQRRRRQEPAIDAGRALRGNEPPDPGVDPSDRLMREERATEIQQALGRLTEEFRLVLVMRDVDGFDYQSIARILDLSVGTVRSRLHRARSLMREQLRHHHYGSRAE
ncbi:MAG: RNA polymerase sigma factor [Pirellulaceae bacterium]